MSRRRNKPTMSTTTVNMPDGTTQEAPVAQYPAGTTGMDIGEGHPPGEEYPESETNTMTEEELKAKEAAEADAREKRAAGVKGPRKLKPNEQKVVKYFLDTYIAETDPADKVVTFDQLHADMKPWFQPSMKDNVIGRGIFNAVYDDTTKQLVGVHLTAIGADLYFSLLRKGQSQAVSPGRKAAAKTGGAVVSRATKYPDNLKLRKLANGNPRQVGSHGYHAYNMYEDGMTYNQYLTKTYDTSLVSSGANTPFSGPKRVHWDWDLLHGHIGLYYEGVPEFEDDGSPNPKFWFINTSGQKTAPEMTEQEKLDAESAVTEAAAE